MIRRIPDADTRRAGRDRQAFSVYKRRETKITRAEVVIIFLALIRTITAYYQLKTRLGNILPEGQAEPIITGSLVAALFRLALTLLSFRQVPRHARGFRAGNYFASATKIFLFTRVTEAGPGAKRPRRATGVAKGAGNGSGRRGQCQGEAA